MRWLRNVGVSYWRWSMNRGSRWAKALALSAPVIVLVVIVAAVAGGGEKKETAAPTAVDAPAVTATTSAGIAPKCQARGALPDQAYTPGQADPGVTQANIQTTICKSGYTDTVRPSSTFTAELKLQQIKDYGLTLAPSEVEEDHLIPLELGGAPKDPKNLWPQPWTGAQNATDKDKIENALKAAVCAGAIQLAQAQQRIATDWTTAAAGLPTAAAATTVPTAPAAASTSPASGRAAPVDRNNCPAAYPIKGNRDSMIYHVPGGASYSRTNPEECFATEADAQAAGYRRAER